MVEGTRRGKPLNKYTDAVSELFSAKGISDENDAREMIFDHLAIDLLCVNLGVWMEKSVSFDESA